MVKKAVCFSVCGSACPPEEGLFLFFRFTEVCFITGSGAALFAGEFIIRTAVVGFVVFLAFFTHCLVLLG